MSRRSRKRTSVEATLLLALTIAAQAAFGAEQGVDCSQAGSAVEELVCRNPELTDLDRKLAGYYEGARRRFLKQSGECLQQDQRNWLDSVRNACADAACLKKAYLHRLATLHAAQPGVAEIEDLRLPPQPTLAAIIPPNGDADSIPVEPSTPVMLTGRYSLSDDYGLTLVDEQSRLHVLASLLNQETPIELATLEEEQARIRVRGRLLDRKPASEDYPDLAPPHGVFDPHECIFVYRLPP